MFHLAHPKTQRASGLWQRQHPAQLQWPGPEADLLVGRVFRTFLYRRSNGTEPIKKLSFSWLNLVALQQ
jgi:hypothetical protein